MQVFELRYTPKQYTYSKKTHHGTQENYFLHMHCFRYSPLNSSFNPKTSECLIQPETQDSLSPDPQETYALFQSQTKMEKGCRDVFQFNSLLGIPKLISIDIVCLSFWSKSLVLDPTFEYLPPLTH